MLMAWIGKRALGGIARGWWVLGALAAICALWLWLGAREEADDRHNQVIGSTIEREKAASAAIERVEQANAIRNEMVTADSRFDYDQCLRTARTPANCERFLRDRSEAIR